jgi:hypothetical protein
MITRYLFMFCFSLSLGFAAYAADPAQPKTNETTEKPATDKATAIEDETGMCFRGTNCDGEKMGYKTIADCKTASGNSWHGHTMIGGHDRCISRDIDNLDWRQ